MTWLFMYWFLWFHILLHYAIVYFVSISNPISFTCIDHHIIFKYYLIFLHLITIYSFNLFINILGFFILQLNYHLFFYIVLSFQYHVSRYSLPFITLDYLLLWYPRCFTTCISIILQPNSAPWYLQSSIYTTFFTFYLYLWSYFLILAFLGMTNDISLSILSEVHFDADYFYYILSFIIMLVLFSNYITPSIIDI